MFVALLAGLIFNAQGLLATARQLPYGSTTRSVSITLLRPVNDVTNALFLNSPRDGLQWALGRHSQGTSGDPFANVPKVTQPQTTGSGPTTAEHVAAGLEHRHRPRHQPDHRRDRSAAETDSRETPADAGDR